MDRNMGRPGQMISSGVTRRPPLPPREVSQHDELIKYIQEAWNKITSEQAPVTYKSLPDEQRNLNGFIPFDLDSWWGRRLVQNIQISRGQQS